MIPIKRLLVISSLVFTAGATAQNAVIFQNAYTNGGHADGAVYVGGNWYGSNYEANQHSVGPFGIYLGGGNYTANFLRVWTVNTWTAADQEVTNGINRVKVGSGLIVPYIHAGSIVDRRLLRDENIRITIGNG